MDVQSSPVRKCFEAAAAVFVKTVAQIGCSEWDQPGLGDWTVRALVGHASRAFSTIETYLGAAQNGDAVRLDEAVAYFRAAREALSDPGAVAERGRQAGAALGDEPFNAVRSLAERVVRLVAETPNEADVTTPIGTMTLVTYLPTRTFELAVHGLDIARAIGVDIDVDLGEPILASLELATQLAGEKVDLTAPLLLALTGRISLPVGFSLL